MNPAYVAIFGIIWSTIVAAVGWHMGYRSGLTQQRKLKLGEFCSFVKLLRNKTESRQCYEFGMGPDDFTNHIKSMPALDNAVIGVEQHISKSYKVAFDSALSSYRSIG